MEALVGRREGDQPLQCVKHRSVDRQGLGGIVVPVEIDRQHGLQRVDARPEHRADRKIEMMGKGRVDVHSPGEIFGEPAVGVPAVQMGILREDEAEALVAREGGEDMVHHRVFASDEMVPQELPPSLADGRVHMRASLAVEVPDDVVALEGFETEARQHRAEIAAAIGKAVDPGRLARLAQDGPQFVRAGFVGRGEEEIDGRPVVLEPFEERLEEVRVVEMRVDGDAQIRSPLGRRRAGRDHGMRPASLRLSRAQEMHERVLAGALVEGLAGFRVDQGMETLQRTPDEEAGAGAGPRRGAVGSRQVSLDGLLARQVAVETEIELGVEGFGRGEAFPLALDLRLLAGGLMSECVDLRHIGRSCRNFVRQEFASPVRALHGGPDRG